MSCDQLLFDKKFLLSVDSDHFFRFACGDDKQVLKGERLQRLTSLKKDHEELEKKRRERERESSQARPQPKRFPGTCHSCGKQGHRVSQCKELKKDK